MTATYISGLMGFVLFLSNYCFMASILVFYFTSSKWTQLKKQLKYRTQNNNNKKSHNITNNITKTIKRDWKNVVSNGGVAMIFSLFYLLKSGSREVAIDFGKYYDISWFAISVLGAFSCANGDTWASELGSLLSTGDPYLITSLQPVPKGTNGGVSTYGLLVSALGGLSIGLAFYLPLVFSAQESSPPQLIPLLIVGLFGGLFGSVIDSLLGATLQFSGLNTKTGKIVEEMGPNVKHINGVQILDNHCVNLLSNLITAMVTPYFASYLWEYF